MNKRATSPKALRERILSRRQDYPELIHVPNKARKALRNEDNCHKTTLMLHIERFHRRPVEELIWAESIPEVAKRLEVSEFTVSKWRREFPLNEYYRGPNNRKLPVAKSG